MLPEMVGRDVLTGAPATGVGAGAVTTPVTEETAVLAPSLFFAVTTTRNVRFTSPFCSV